MAAGSGSILALAARLRALDDAELARLVALREVRRADIRDFFDLAEALLDRGSVQAALQRLDRPTLAVLSVAGELAETAAPTADRIAERLGRPVDEVLPSLATAVETGLLGSESGRYAPWDAVVEQLRAWPAFGLPSRADLVDPPAPPVDVALDDADRRFIDRGAADRAFGTVVAVSEVIAELREHPARRLARGGIALPDARRLSAHAGVEPDELDLVLEIAAHASLAHVDGTEWVASTRAESWLDEDRAARWRALAAGWIDALPTELRDLLRGRSGSGWGDALLAHLRWLYPGGGDWVLERARSATRIADLLGIQSLGVASTPGAVLLHDGADAATAHIAASFPADVDRVYLQHDLTVIAPGPLRADLERRLRGLAIAEARGIASSFRFTAASVDRALLAGETEASVREFLAEVSLTGIPQPLDYLIAETARRVGSIRVGARDDDGTGVGTHSYVRSADATLLGQVAVDPSLAVLGLVRVGERLESRFDVDVIAATLADARYPVAREDSEGRVLLGRPTRRTADGATISDEAASALVARVRAAAAAEPEGHERAWVARQLELAVKGRLSVLASVRMPDGVIVDYLLEPSGLAGGRLRALDRRADIERTLPLSSIVAVRAPDATAD